MTERIEVGKIVKAQGIKGQVKILTDNAFLFNKLKKAYIDGKIYNVENVIKDNENTVFIKFAEIIDRNMAEEFRDKKVEIDKINAVLPKGTYFISDIIGCNVVIEDKIIGKIYDVMNYGASDVYSIELLNGKKAMFPSLDKTLLNTDIKNKVITLDKTSFDETVVYEDDNTNEDKQ